MNPTVEGEDLKGAGVAQRKGLELKTLGLPLDPGQTSQICLRRVSRGHTSSRLRWGAGQRGGGTLK